MYAAVARTHIPNTTPPQLPIVGICLPKASANDSRRRPSVACAKITTLFSAAFRCWLFVYVLQRKFCFACTSLMRQCLQPHFHCLYDFTNTKISPRFLPGLVSNFVIEENWVSFDQRCRLQSTQHYYANVCMYGWMKVCVVCVCVYWVYAFGSSKWNDCEPNTYLTLNLAA